MYLKESVTFPDKSFQSWSTWEVPRPEIIASLLYGHEIIRFGIPWDISTGFIYWFYITRRSWIEGVDTCLIFLQKNTDWGLTKCFIRQCLLEGVDTCLIFLSQNVGCGYRNTSILFWFCQIAFYFQLGILISFQFGSRLLLNNNWGSKK